MSMMNDLIGKVTSAASSLINFDNMDISAIKGYAEKFGLWDNIVAMMPAEMAAKLEDGSLTKEEMLSIVPDLKDMIMSKISGSSEVATDVAADAASVAEEVK